MKLPLAVLIIASLAPASPHSRSPFAAYNEGVLKMKDGRLREAEDALREALRSNQESIQPVALYNLGHVRFLQGQDTLKGVGDPKQLAAAAEATRAAAKAAFENGTKALQKDELMELVAAYMEARVARRQLRELRDETTRTLDLLATVKGAWQRSQGDFGSSAELDATNPDAPFNEKVVERHLEELEKFRQKMEEQQEVVSQMRKQMQEMMKQMRGKIPKEMQQQSDGEEGDEEEEEEGQSDEPGKKEERIGDRQQQRIGGDREVSPEMAQWLKETMKRRTMAPGGEQGEGFRPSDEPQQPRSRKGKDW